MTSKETIQHESRAALVPLPRPDQEHAEGERLSDVDEWGRSEHVRAIARRLYAPLYNNWFRVEWEGLEKIPKTGGALLVANHAGAIPSDAPVIMHGIETELGRPVYGMADYFFRQAPWLGTMWARVGGVPAHPDNALRLLRDQGQLAVVFPEGTKGPSKTYTDRYRLRRFGRGGFVEIAMRAGVPVIPIAVIGAEESMPILFRLPSLARALGVPYVPIDGQHVGVWPPRAWPLLPGEVQAARPRPGHLRRPPGPGAVLQEPGHGRSREHPHPPSRDPVRHAARPPQRVVRLSARGTAGPDHRASTRSGGAGRPRPSRRTPRSR